VRAAAGRAKSRRRASLHDANGGAARQLYVPAAWVAAIIGIALSGASLAKIGAAVAGGADDFARAIGAGFAGVGQNAPALATFGAGELFIDLALAAAVAVSYFVIRPRLAAHLASVSEAS
jgi:hypothetical protein